VASDAPRTVAPVARRRRPRTPRAGAALIRRNRASSCAECGRQIAPLELAAYFGPRTLLCTTEPGCRADPDARARAHALAIERVARRSRTKTRHGKAAAAIAGSLADADARAAGQATSGREAVHKRVGFGRHKSRAERRRPLRAAQELGRFPVGGDDNVHRRPDVAGRHGRPRSEETTA